MSLRIITIQQVEVYSMDVVFQNFRRSFAPSTPFFHSLSLDLQATMEELYRQVNRYSTLEDNIRASTQNVMIINRPDGSSKPEGKKPPKPRECQGKNRKRSRDQSQKKREPQQFTPLNITYEKLLPLICDFPDFKWLAPIQTDPSQRDSSIRCDYHRDHGHETNKCRSLKFMVQRLIKEGHLRRYIREVDHGEESIPVVDRSTTRTATPFECSPTINYILGGPFDDQYQSKCKQKKLLRIATVKAWVNTVYAGGSR